MKDFKEEIGPLAEVLEGVFYVEGGSLFVPGNDAPVAEILEPFLDQQVLVVVHHQPPSVFDVEHWGAGCCMWESMGHCPYGHHHEPHKLFSANLRGVLWRDGQDWFVGQQKLDLGPLEGHISRLVITLLEPPDALTQSLDDIDPMTVDPKDLEMRLNKLSTIMSGLSSIIDEFKSDGDDASS